MFDRYVRTDLAEAVQSCLGELEANGAAARLGLPVAELWADHQRGRRDVGMALDPPGLSSHRAVDRRQSLDL